ncbi:MAG: flagellar FlbD family protein [Candidatus Kapaibacteriota bacterium]|jgi:flagellar protein FlbD
MIVLTKIDGQRIVINAEEIETVEIGQNSVISLKSGRKYLVKENYNEIIHLVIEYKQKLHHASPKIDDKKD